MDAVDLSSTNMRKSGTHTTLPPFTTCGQNEESTPSLPFFPLSLPPSLEQSDTLVHLQN